MKSSLHISDTNTTTRIEGPPDPIARPGVRVLVIGGTTFIGRLLVTELVKAGHQLSILHRSKQHCFGKRIANLAADRNDAPAVKQAIAGQRFDVVYDLAYDWDHGTNAEQVESVARLFDGHVSRYIFMSSISAYGDGLNHHEGDALAPDDHPSHYVRNKAMSERSLFRLYQKSGFPIVTLRPPFVYGPDNPFYREAFFWDRFRLGRKIILPSDGHRLMQFIFVKDLVDMAIKVLEPRNVIGHAFNAANPRPLTQHDIVLELAKAAGVKSPQLVSIPRDAIVKAGGEAAGKKLYFGYNFDLPAITEVITKAQRMLAFKPIDFAAGLKLTHRAYQRTQAASRPDFHFEDELLQKFGSLAVHPN